MVGGGYAQDNQIFSGKPESDFHQCGMIAIPGFAVSTDFSEANGVVQPIPNPVYEKPTTWMEDLQELYPDEMEKSPLRVGQPPVARRPTWNRTWPSPSPWTG